MASFPAGMMSVASAEKAKGKEEEEEEKDNVKKEKVVAEKDEVVPSLERLTQSIQGLDNESLEKQVKNNGGDVEHVIKTKDDERDVLCASANI